jgi:hypothetical protein
MTVVPDKPENKEKAKKAKKLEKLVESLIAAGFINQKQLPEKLSMLEAFTVIQASMNAAVQDAT